MPTTTLTYEQAIELAPEQEYFSGQPPEVGWWMTRYGCGDTFSMHGMRWWNGVFWSPKIVLCDLVIGDKIADMKSHFTLNEIQYCARFWEGK